MDLAAANLARLRQLRAEYIRSYVGTPSPWRRKDARNWALFYSNLIRRVYGARPS
jgi:hypothetical protein